MIIDRRLLLLATLAAAAANPATADTPRSGGTLNVGFDDDAKTFDPALSVQLSERQVLYCVFNTLTAVGPDFSIQPELARAWTTENGGLRYVFQLVEGVKFHDGTPFDAAAVKWNIDHRLDPANASPQRAQLASVIHSVEVVGPATVAFNLTAPHPGLLADLSDRAGFMMSPTAVQKLGPDFGRHPVGSGPFVFKQWTEGNAVTLERNPAYWVAGRPYLDAIVLRDIPNHVIGLQRMIVGEVDIVTSLSPDDLRQVEGNDAFSIEQAKVGRWYSLQYQVDKPPFDNAKLRQAIAYALDRKRLNDLTMRGRATIANGPTPPGLWWSSPDAVTYPYDPEKSRTLLQEAGVAPGTVLVLSVSSDLLTRKIDQLVVEQLAAVGLTVQLQPVSAAESYARVVQRAINFTPMSWTQRADPDGLLYILFDSHGFANTTGYANPEVDKLLEQARTSLDQDERRALYAQAKNQIMRDLPYIPLFFAAEYAVISKSVHGFVWPPDQIPRYRDAWKSAT
jgi:peptide/nickel transport system substrate-binding protein